MKRFIINDNMHGQTILLIVNCTQEAVIEWIKKKFKATDEVSRGANGRCFCLEHTDGTQVHIIWMEKWNSDIRDFGLLAHEVLHLTIGVLDDLGFRLHESSEEAYTYYLQHLISQCLGKLCPVRKRK